MDRPQLEGAVIDLLAARAPEASICPSDVARYLAGDEDNWRALMEPVRQAAAALAGQGLVRVTQGEVEVDLSRPVKGPVRIRRGRAWPTDTP